ncbi:uncharacterized protein UTRI_05282_B [Ustilago trichophora]|uniref:Zn(2)-C6 fungal-type domain-containing protein n=1 Tax=Ustilago trichophora TaxID=86804 RepID=A0A5C3EMZ3_9BASI|nr:uncharacterized protein UTRI_05282_B [Ustilago trichophora]
MPPISSVGSSRRKLGQPTVCLECYLRKVKCDRQRPCSTCVRRGTEHLCKTFNTSELDPETLQKKQARRSLAEINAILEASSQNDTSDHADDPDPQQPSDPQHQPPEHPMMAFINLMLKDLQVQEDAQAASSHASPDSASPSTTFTTGMGSPAPSRSAVSRYLEKGCLTKIGEFCAIVPDWSQLQALLRHYLWHVDWKFLITVQDLLEVQMKDLWVRVILPAQAYDGRRDSVSGISLQPGDLSRLALLASVLGETVETMAPETISETLPISRPGVFAAGPVKIESDANPRVKALLLLTYHVPALIEECVRLDEMSIELVQANLSAFSLWSNQGLHGTGTNEFPRWNVTIRAAKGCNLFEDPGSNTSFSQVELDHRRRLAWLVYGYDHAFAVGANTKPLIVESQFSVDQPSDAAPWSATGAPPDACLAKLEVEGGRIAQLVSSTLCYGPPLHRKAMETDSKILSTLSQIHPSYNYDSPDLTLDPLDPFRARRRCWLALTTAWQRGSLHRQFFFPNGRITNGELATSRHIATDSALRSIIAVRDLRKMQNRFSDHMASAWWFQYYTEPCMTLATAALLLIRSKGSGVPGLSNEPLCWPTMMHFTRTIDDCIQDLESSTRDREACLPSLLKFAEGCAKLIKQLRSAVQTSFDAFVQSQPELASLKSLTIDESVIPLLHPRSRQKSPAESSSNSGSSAASGNHATKRSADASSTGRRTSSANATGGTRSRKSTSGGSRGGGGGSPSKAMAATAMFGDSLSVSPRTSITPTTTTVPPTTSFAQYQPQYQNPVSTSTSSSSPAETDLPPGTLSLSFTSQQHPQPFAAAPHFGVPTTFSLQQQNHLLSPAEPFALRQFYSSSEAEVEGQGSTRSGAAADWIAEVHQLGLVLGADQQQQQ